ncbi:MAG TPA: type II secretion system protein GspJ [Candidatus Paceibacterota bacterium]|nr:type II secretion system protein GspJ [Verrucomicrobiota bacterium]HRY46830.1 type II secretion system protein GspJ [Candidatus Paceibacterota bacterium]HSA01619.1 type II secretion system protein GspJ [Candidatus Paceibacterota bacterium]
MKPISQRHDLRSSRGFTLIEVLLAVVIFGLVIAAAHSVFYGAVSLRNKTVRMFEQTLPVEQSLTILKRDLAGMVLPGGTLSGEFSTGTVISTNSTMNSAIWSLGDLILPEFTTTTGSLDDWEPWGNLQRVSYYLTESTNQVLGRDLVRMVNRNLLPTLDEQPVQQWLMSGVEDMVCSFYDGVEWLDTWDPTATEMTLPLAVKVQILLAVENEDDRNPITDILEFVVPIPVQPSTNQVAQSSGGEP